MLTLHAAHEHDVLDEQWVVPAELLGLREIRDASGRASRPAEDRGCPGRGRKDADDDLEERRLPGAIRADERDELAGLHVEIHASDDRMPGLISGGYAAELDHVTHPA